MSGRSSRTCHLLVELALLVLVAPLTAARLPLPSASAYDMADTLAAIQRQASTINAANFLPRLLSPFVRVIPALCPTGLDHFGSGTCLAHDQCAALRGTATATCALGFGTCCVVRETCGATSVAASHFFANPSYPSADSEVGGGTCALAVEPCRRDTCQLRVDFVDVRLEQPNPVTGVCDVDSVVVTGNGANHAKIPSLCGDLSGQHFYITVEPTCSPTKVHVDMNAAVKSSRKFNIKVTQIPCGSPDLAPAGCLQYYNNTSGTVRSYNNQDASQSRLIAGQNYASCVAVLPGYCSISWTARRAIDMPSSCGAYREGRVGFIKNALRSGGSCCKSSYLLIPGATCPGLAFGGNCMVDDPRFCGGNFPQDTQVMSWHQPFALFTYLPQPLDSTYEGYALDYTLNRCS